MSSLWRNQSYVLSSIFLPLPSSSIVSYLSIVLLSWFFYLPHSSYCSPFPFLPYCSKNNHIPMPMLLSCCTTHFSFLDQSPLPFYLIWLMSWSFPSWIILPHDSPILPLTHFLIHSSSFSHHYQSSHTVSNTWLVADCLNTALRSYLNIAFLIPIKDDGYLPSHWLGSIFNAASLWLIVGLLCVYKPLCFPCNVTKVHPKFKFKHSKFKAS